MGCRDDRKMALRDKELVAIKIIRRQKLFINQARYEWQVLEALNKTADNGKRAFKGTPISSFLVGMYDAFTHLGHPCFSFELLIPARNTMEASIGVRLKMNLEK